MEPAEKAGSGEITIAISRSILSNKRSKAVRRMPDGLAVFGKLSGRGYSPQRRRFRRKQALQMPLAIATPPMKMG